MKGANMKSVIAAILTWPILLITAGVYAQGGLKEVEFQLYRVTPKSTETSFIARVPALPAQGQVVIDWMKANGSMKLVESHTVKLQAGTGFFSSMKPIAVDSIPGITISANNRRIGTEISTQGALYAGKAILKFSFKHEEPTGESMVMLTDRSGREVRSPITDFYEIVFSGFFELNKPVVLSDFRNGQFVLLVITPRA